MQIMDILTGQILYSGLELLIFLVQDRMCTEAAKRPKAAMLWVNLTVKILLKSWKMEKMINVRFLPAMHELYSSLNFLGANF